MKAILTLERAYLKTTLKYIVMHHFLMLYNNTCTFLADIIHWSCVSVQTVSTWFKWQCFSTTWTFYSFCATTTAGALPKIRIWNICPASKLQLLHESLSISLSISRRIKLHEFPNGLLDLKQLRILDFSQNNLTTVP